MSHRLLRSIAMTAFALATAMMSPALLAAQTRDSPRLTLGVSFGVTQGTDFWSVPNQAVIAPEAQFDTFDIHRRLSGNITFGFHATVFRSPNLGFTGEVSYIGIGTEDTCRLATSTGNAQNAEACNALNRSSRSTSAANFFVGAVVRPWSRAAIQPYALARAGISAVSDNLTSLTAFMGSSTVQIYPSRGGLDARPAGALGIGLATNFGAGYQFRVEARETWLQLSTVTGPSARDGIEPPKGNVFKGLGNILIGFDVVLEKSRGRRY